jgi:hypothetical protein
MLMATGFIRAPKTTRVGHARPGQSCSDVILRLLEFEGGKR